MRFYVLENIKAIEVLEKVLELARPERSNL